MRLHKRPEVYGDRTFHYAVPQPEVFRALTNELEDWLVLQTGEVMPRVRVVWTGRSVQWSSLWPVSPKDTILFDLEERDQRTYVRVRWFSLTPPDERGIAITRQRLSKKIGGDLRAWIESAYTTRRWSGGPA